MSVAHSRFAGSARRVVGALFLTAALLVAAPVGTASAAGTLSCRASVANLFGFEPIVANAPDSPCKSENKALLFQTLANPSDPTQFVSAQLAHAQTVFTPATLLTKPEGTAHAEAAAALLSGGSAGFLLVNGGRADAKVSCAGFHEVFSSSSSVVSVNANGNLIAIPPNNGHADIPLGQLGTIHLNEVINTPTSRTVRAVWWERPDPELDLIVAEAKVDFTGSPCS